MNRKQLIDRIQQLQFMTVELNLYLDTHPDDQRAIMEYNCYTQQLKQLRMQYAQMYGPLTNFGYCMNHQQKWAWIYDKWPWQIDEKYDCRNEVEDNVGI